MAGVHIFTTVFVTESVTQRDGGQSVTWQVAEERAKGVQSASPCPLTSEGDQASHSAIEIRHTYKIFVGKHEKKIRG
jgi:hypothetical protein